MMAPHGWRVLHDAGGSSVVLAVDYWVGRTEAGFRELAAALRGPATVLETSPPSGVPSDPQSYLGPWLEGLPDDVVVELVLGNCVGAGYALALADGLARRTNGQAPPVVLFNPERASAETIGAEFARITSGLGRVTAEPVGTVGELPAYVTQLAEVYRGMLTEHVADDDDLDDEFVEELVTFVRGYLTYLAAGARLELATLPPAAVALTSAVSCTGLDLAARAVRFDVDRAGLMTHPEVVQAVSDMIGVTR